MEGLPVDCGGAYAVAAGCLYCGGLYCGAYAAYGVAADGLAWLGDGAFGGGAGLGKRRRAASPEGPALVLGGGQAIPQARRPPLLLPLYAHRTPLANLS